MLKIELKFNNEGSIVEFTLTGHANFAEYGEDIVCSAVSALSQTAVRGLQKYFGEVLEVTKSRGILKCSLPDKLNREQRIIADAILNTMYWGIKDIESEYHKYLKVNIKEV